MNILKVFLIAFCLTNGLTLFAHVITHEDSLDNEFDRKVQALLGNDLKGETIPDFFISSEKQIVLSRNKLRSKITFINFWLEACAPCIAQFQAMEKFYNKNKSRKEFLFVSITSEPDSVIERIRKENGLTYPVYHLSADSCRQIISKMGFPAILIVDKNLKIAFSTSGGSLNPDNVDKQLNHFIQAELEKELSRVSLLKEIRY